MGVLGGGLMGTQYDVLGGVVILLSVVSIVGSVIQLVAGILGAKNWQNPDKAMPCIVMGCIVIVISLINTIGTAASSGFNASSIFSILLGLVLPILYLVGAFQLKKPA